MQRRDISESLKARFIAIDAMMIDHLRSFEKDRKLSTYFQAQQLASIRQSPTLLKEITATADAFFMLYKHHIRDINRTYYAATGGYLLSDQDTLEDDSNTDFEYNVGYQNIFLEKVASLSPEQQQQYYNHLGTYSFQLDLLIQSRRKWQLQLIKQNSDPDRANNLICVIAEVYYETLPFFNSTSKDSKLDHDISAYQTSIVAYKTFLSSEEQLLWEKHFHSNKTICRKIVTTAYKHALSWDHNVINQTVSLRGLFADETLFKAHSNDHDYSSYLTHLIKARMDDVLDEFYTLVSKRWKAKFEELNALTEYFAQQKIAIDENDKKKLTDLFDSLYPGDWIRGTTRLQLQYSFNRGDKNEFSIKIPDKINVDEKSVGYFTTSFEEAKKLEASLENRLTQDIQKIFVGFFAIEKNLLNMTNDWEDKKNIIFLIEYVLAACGFARGTYNKAIKIQSASNPSSKALIKMHAYLKQTIDKSLHAIERRGEGYTEVHMTAGYGLMPIQHHETIRGNPTAAMKDLKIILQKLDFSKIDIDISEEEKKEIENRAIAECERRYQQPVNRDPLKMTSTLASSRVKKSPEQQAQQSPGKSVKYLYESIKAKKDEFNKLITIPLFHNERQIIQKQYKALMLDQSDTELFNKLQKKIKLLEQCVNILAAIDDQNEKDRFLKILKSAAKIENVPAIIEQYQLKTRSTSTPASSTAEVTREQINQQPSSPPPPAKQKAVDLQSLIGRNNSIARRNEFEELMKISWIKQEYDAVQKYGGAIFFATGTRREALLNEADSQLTLLEECVDILAAIDDQNEKDSFVQALTASNVKDVSEVIKQHQSKNKDVADEGKQRSDQFLDDFHSSSSESSSDQFLDDFHSSSSESSGEFFEYLNEQRRIAGIEFRKTAIDDLIKEYQALPEIPPITEGMHEESKSSLRYLNNSISFLPTRDALEKMDIQSLNKKKQEISKLKKEFNKIIKEVSDLESVCREVRALYAEMGMESSYNSFFFERDKSLILPEVIIGFEAEKERLVAEKKKRVLETKEAEAKAAEAKAEQARQAAEEEKNKMIEERERAIEKLIKEYETLPPLLEIKDEMHAISKATLQAYNEYIEDFTSRAQIEWLTKSAIQERLNSLLNLKNNINHINEKIAAFELVRQEVQALRAEMGEEPFKEETKKKYINNEFLESFQVEKERLLAEKATRELTAKAAEEARISKEQEEQEEKEAKRQALIAKIAALKVAEERAKEKLAEAKKLKAQKEAVLEEAKNELVEAKKLKEEAESKEKAAQAAEQAAAETEEKAKGKEKQVDLNISAKEKEIKDLAAKAELTKAAQKAQLEERLKLVLEAKEKMDVSLAEAKANETALGKAAKIANAEALEAQAASDAANQSYQADLTVLSAELAEKQKAEVEKEEALERLQGEEKDAHIALDRVVKKEKKKLAALQKVETVLTEKESAITAEEKRLEKEKREEEERAEQARRAVRRQARIAAQEEKQRKQIIDGLQQAITGLTPQLQVVNDQLHAASQARLAEVTQQVQAFDQLVLDGLTADEAKAKLVEVQDLSQEIKKANEEVRAVESLRAEVDQLRNQTKRPSQDYAGIATIEALKQQLERDQQTIREEEQTREDQVMGLKARRGALPSSITVTTDMPVAVQNRFAALQKQCAQEKAKSDTKLSLDEIGTASDSLDQLEKEIEDVNAEVEVVKGLLSAVKSLSDAELIPAVDTNSIEEIEELKSTLQASIQQGITTFDQEVQTLSATRTTLTTELTEIEKELDSVEKNTDEISVQYVKTLRARKQQAEESVTKIDELVTFTKGKDKPISEVVKQRSVVQPLKERVEKSAKSNQKNRKQYVEIVEKNYTRALADLSKDENYQVLEERQQALIAERDALSQKTDFYAEGQADYIAFLDKQIPAYQAIASKVQPTPIAATASMSVVEVAKKQQALETYKKEMKKEIELLDARVKLGKRMYLHFKAKASIAIQVERSQKMMDQFVYERTKAIRERITVINTKVDIPAKIASCLKKIDAFQSEVAPLSTASRIWLSFLDLLGYPQERLKPMAMRSAAYLRERKKDMEEILKEINEINAYDTSKPMEITTDKDDRMAQPEPQPDSPGRKNKNALSVAERAQVGTTTDWGRGRADQSPQEKLQERIKAMQCEIDKKTWTTYAKLPSQQENMQKQWMTLLAEMQGVLNLIGDKREQEIILIPKTNDTGQAIKPEQKYKLISPETLRLPKHGIYTTQDKKMSQYLEELDQRIITATNNQSVAFNNIVKPY